MKIATCSEHSRSFSVSAPRCWELEKTLIDGGLVTDQIIKRCDYAISARNGKDRRYFFYVELKGADLLKAISQLESTINNLGSLSDGYQEKHARAVCSRIIPFVISTAQVSVARFKRKYGVQLKWHSNSGTFTIRD
jgi:hypothetical protein